MANVKLSYAADSQLTITLASLASDTNLLAGRESTSVDNSSNLYLDYLISGKVTTGTTPTASRQIEVWVVTPIEDTPTWPDVFDGTDSAETITSADIKFAICKPVALITTSNTSDRTYPFGQVSLANLFGGICPKTFAIFVVHNTGVALNATGSNHDITVQGIFTTVV